MGHKYNIAIEDIDQAHRDIIDNAGIPDYRSASATAAERILLSGLTLILAEIRIRSNVTAL